jgi:ABC-type proline/glycine betaine transport system permease subunit
MRRVIIAFALTPLIAVSPVLAFGDGIGAVLYSIFLLIAYASAALLGIPLFLLLRRRRWLHPWQVAVAGIACAVPGAVLNLLTSPSGLVASQGTFTTSLVLACGLLAGAAFWLLGVSGNTELNHAHAASGRGV